MNDAIGFSNKEMQIILVDSCFAWLVAGSRKSFNCYAAIQSIVANNVLVKKFEEVPKYSTKKS